MSTSSTLVSFVRTRPAWISRKSRSSKRKRQPTRAVSLVSSGEAEAGRFERFQDQEETSGTACSKLACPPVLISGDAHSRRTRQADIVQLLALECSAGGKGYRKPVRTAATSSGADDKKLSLALKKLGALFCPFT